MRASLLVFVCLVGATAWAQDPGMMAAQQASDAAAQASMQASQAAAQASTQATQQASAAGAAAGCGVVPPSITLKSGTYQQAQTTLLTDRQRNVEIHYTIDGWLPTAESPRFTAPVRITVSTVLLARSYAPGCGWSSTATANFLLPNAAAPVPSAVRVSADGVLAKGTLVPLRFTAPVASAIAKVGDLVPLELASLVEVGSRTLQPSAVRVIAYLTAVHRPGTFGRAGDIEFALQSMEVEGISVPLQGEQTARGASRTGRASVLWLVPGLEVGAIAVHGKNVVIPAGASVTATVAEDVHLPPQKAAAETEGPGASKDVRKPTILK